MVHHTCALTQAHKHEGQVLQPETAAFRDLVRGGISDKERKESVLRGGQEGRPRKASVKVKCHSAASSEPKCKGGVGWREKPVQRQVTDEGQVLTKEKDMWEVCSEERQ